MTQDELIRVADWLRERAESISTQEQFADSRIKALLQVANEWDDAAEDARTSDDDSK